MSNQKPLSGNLLDYGNSLSRGLVGFWLMNEGSGNKVFDLSGNGQNATISAGTWIVGETGSALYTVAIVLSIGSVSPKLSEPAYTIIFKAKPDNITDNQYVSGGDGADQNKRNVVLGFQDGFWNVFNGVYPTGTPGDTQITATAGEWQTVAYVTDGISIWGYLNGIQQFSETGHITPSATITDFAIMAVGVYIGAKEYVYIYNRALSASEIALLYREPFQMIRTRRRRIIIPEDIAAVALARAKIDCGLASTSPLIRGLVA